MSSLTISFEISDISKVPKTYPRIAVVGGGVSGISTALAIITSVPQCQLTVYSKEYSPDTTGDGAAGLWGPYLPYGTPEDKIKKWALPTWKLVESWSRRGDPGVFFIPKCYITKDDNGSLPPYKNMVYGFKEMDQKELKTYGSEYVSGYSYTTVIAEASQFLPRMVNQIKRLGGRFEIKNLQSLQEISDQVDIIVNCSGLGSYNLVSDTSMFPIRGQIINVYAPWIKQVLIEISEDTNSYIIPNTNKIILGGTSQMNDWRTDVDENDKRTIFENACRHMPSLKNSEIINDWVGLRPAREKGIRIETEEIILNQKKIQVVHNYGHCGSGISLMWGCALEASGLVGNIINRDFFPTNSKL